MDARRNGRRRPAEDGRVRKHAVSTVDETERPTIGLPYLSIVVTSRNDDHGGDVLHRTQVFLDGLAAQADRHALDVELVLVEWNPPADRPRLADVLRWPEAGEHFEARIVEVPPEVHARLEHADRLPLFQMLAKNVGIRRARGRFVLATNIDLLFSDELVAFLAEGGLDPMRLYRTDRYDVDVGIPDAPTDERLAWCDRNLLRVCRREGTYDVRSGRFYRIYEDTRVPLWLAPWLRFARFLGRATRHLAVRSITRPLRLLRRLGLGAWLRSARASHAVAVALAAIALALLDPAAKHFDLHRADRLRTRLRRIARGHRQAKRRPRRRRPRLRFRLPKISPAQLIAETRSATSLRWRFLQHAWLGERARMRLHTNACGDFTLLSRDGWLATEAYPELELFSMHVDSLFMYRAHYAGFRELVLPYRVYHLEHDAGFKPDEKGLAALNTRLQQSAIPQISNEQFLDWVIQMYQTRRQVFPKRPTWGFGKEALPELRVAPRLDTQASGLGRTKEVA
jgi:hypothetical protein